MELLSVNIRQDFLRTLNEHFRSRNWTYHFEFKAPISLYELVSGTPVSSIWTDPLHPGNQIQIDTDPGRDCEMLTLKFFRHIVELPWNDGTTMTHPNAHGIMAIIPHTTEDIDLVFHTIECLYGDMPDGEVSQ